MRKRSVGSPAVCSFVVAVAADFADPDTVDSLPRQAPSAEGTCQDSDCEATVVHCVIPSTALALTRYSMRSSKPLKPPLIVFVTALTSSFAQRGLFILMLIPEPSKRHRRPRTDPRRPIPVWPRSQRRCPYCMPRS